MAEAPLSAGRELAIWARDGLLAGLGANVGAVIALTSVAVWMNGIDRLYRQEFVGLVMVGALVGPSGGLLLGAGLWMCWRALREWWVILLIAGFPFGAAMGLVEASLLMSFVSSTGDREVFATVGALGGGGTLGLGWPVYLVLKVADKPGWAALALAPLIGAGAASVPLALALWLD